MSALRPWTILLVGALVLTALVPGGPMGTADAAILQPTFARYPAPATLTGAGSAAGPSLGADWVSGSAMVQAGTRTYRILFDDTASPPVATWLDVTPATSIANLNPILFTDSTLGRTFAGGQLGACGALAYTDNAGASWVPMGNPCAGATLDHETIAAGPWHVRPIGATWFHGVYYCAHNNGLAQCAASHNGGLTFNAAVPVTCGVPNPGYSGSLEVARDGWIYLPFRTCGASNGVAVSANQGLTWTGFPIASAPSPVQGLDPDVGTTTRGWTYLAYPTSTWGVGVALSKDHGATWTDFGDVARAAGIRASTFHEMVAGDDERASVVYLGSPIAGNPHDPDYMGTWSLYATTTYDAGATWTTVKLTDDVVQRGWICAEGFSCQGGRNLLDFMDAQMDSRGRLVVAYADGCLDACESGPAPSTSAWATIVRQTSGSGLYGVHDPIGVAPPDAPALQAVPGDLRVDLAWAPPAEHGAPVTGYRLYRDGALYRTLAPILSFGDTNVEDGVTYLYQVSAMSAAGESPLSEAVSVLVHLVTPPSEPTAVTAEHRGGVGSGRILVQWGEPAHDGHANVTGFRVYRGIAPGQMRLLAEVGYVDRYTDDGLTQGLTYYYRVSALNAKGEGPMSAEVSAMG